MGQPDEDQLKDLAFARSFTALEWAEVLLYVLVIGLVAADGFWNISRLPGFLQIAAVVVALSGFGNFMGIRYTLVRVGARRD